MIGTVARLSERFSLIDQRTRPLRSRLGFWRGEPFDMEEWSYERDLNLDLFAAFNRLPIFQLLLSPPQFLVEGL
jgi:hypothetical protein